MSTLSSVSSSATSPSPTSFSSSSSLWDRLGDVSYSLWNYLSDIEVFHVMLCNQSSMKKLGSYPIKKLLKLNELPSVGNYTFSSSLTDEITWKQQKGPRIVRISVDSTDNNNHDKDHSISSLLYPNLTEINFISFPFESIKDFIPAGVTRILFKDSSHHSSTKDIFPESTKFIDFGNYNFLIQPDSLPSQITHLIMNNYNHPLAEGVLPKSLTELSITSYTYTFENNVLPICLLSLTLDSFDSPLSPGQLPASLTYLDLGNVSLHRIPENALPFSLKTLKLRHYPDMATSILPPQLTDLTLRKIKSTLPGDMFKYIPLQYLSLYFVIPPTLEPDLFPSTLSDLELNGYLTTVPPDVLPKSLRKVVITAFFRSPLLPSSLPPALTMLQLPIYYPFAIQPHLLPSTLTKLSLPEKFNHFLQPNVLPSSLTSLTFGRDFNTELTVGDTFPKNLLEITFGFDFNATIAPSVLPPQLLRLTFGRSFNQQLTEGVLPSSLKYLKFGWGFKRNLTSSVLPPHLTTLLLGASWTYTLEKLLPASLKTLEFEDYCRFNSTMVLNDSLPSSLTRLKLSDGYAVSIFENVLPTGLEELILGESFNQPLSLGVLPSSLQRLTLGGCYNQKFSAGELPSSLIYLKTGEGYTKEITEGVLPAGLCYLDLSSSRYYPQILSDQILPKSLLAVKYHPSLQTVQSTKSIDEKKDEEDHVQLFLPIATGPANVNVALD